MFYEASPIPGGNLRTQTPCYNNNPQREKQVGYEQNSSCQKLTSPRTVPIQSPTISNSGERVEEGEEGTRIFQTIVM